MKHAFYTVAAIVLAGLRAQAQAVKEKESFTIYPDTADNYINVYIDRQEIRPISFAIYNEEGILQHRWQEKPARSYQKAVSLDNLPAGRYKLVLYNGPDTADRQFIIVRNK